MEYTIENKITKTILEDQIQQAKELLWANGYVVKKINKLMNEDLEECNSLEGDKDCTTCSCNICIFE